jgi:hypothetical protein
MSDFICNLLYLKIFFKKITSFIVMTASVEVYFISDRWNKKIFYYKS